MIGVILVALAIAGITFYNRTRSTGGELVKAVKHERNLAETAIRCPFDGMVAQVSVELGQLVGQQTPVARLVGTDRLKLEVRVSAAELNRLRVGQPVELADPAQPGVRYRGEVARRRWWFSGAMLLLVVPGAGVLIPLVGLDMFAGEEVNMFQVRVRMPTGTNLEATSRTLGEFERAAAGLPRGEVRVVHATAGLLMTDTDWIFRTDLGQLWIDLPMS